MPLDVYPAAPPRGAAHQGSTPPSAQSTAWTHTAAGPTTGPPPVQASAGEPGRTAVGRRSRQGEVAPERSAFGSTPARPRGEHKVSFTLLGGFDPKASLPARSREWAFHGEASPVILPHENVSAQRGLQGGAQPSANISGARGARQARASDAASPLRAAGPLPPRLGQY